MRLNVRLAAGVAVASLALLAGCSTAQPWEGTQLDEAAWNACQHAAEQIQVDGGGQASYALNPTDRRNKYTDIIADLQTSTVPLMTDAGDVLQRTLDGNREVWTLGLDTVAARCQSSGWDPAKN